MPTIISQTKNTDKDSSLDLSWLQTTTTNGASTTISGATPLKATISSSETATPLKSPKSNNFNIPKLPNFNTRLSPIHSQINLPNFNEKTKYDDKIFNLQEKLLEEQRNFQKEKLISQQVNQKELAEWLDHVRELKIVNEKYETDIKNLSNENDKILYELDNVKNELKMLGSEPVSETVIKRLKQFPVLTARQVAEIRLFDLIKPLKMELVEKESLIDKLIVQCEKFKEFYDENVQTDDAIRKLREQYSDQITKQRLEIGDYKNQIEKYKKASQSNTNLTTQLQEYKFEINSLKSQLSSLNSNYNNSQNKFISTEKEFSITKQQLNLLSSDKKYLEQENLSLKGKIHIQDQDLSNQWKELEKLKFDLKLETTEKTKIECNLMEANSKIERLEADLKNVQKILTSSENFNKESHLKAQHDNDMINEKFLNLQKDKNLVDEENLKLSSEISNNKLEFNRMTNIFQKDVKLLEQNLLESQHKSENLLTENLKISSKLKQSELDVYTLSEQLQIIYNDLNKQEIKYDKLVNFQTNLTNLNNGKFNLNAISINGIEDLENEIYTKPFATAILLARKLHEIVTEQGLNGHLSKQNDKKIEKEIKLRKSNENLLKNDVNKLLGLNNQVLKMRAVLKQIGEIDQDEMKLENLENEYKKISNFEVSDNVKSFKICHDDVVEKMGLKESENNYVESVHPVNVM